ncbi:hypothetical protein [Flavivirga rizhaonensis]|uniref:V-type ATP synthase subunit E n=1 Tax=Flavivirga rizhaonensis TaxID=2559571 RepID=A0A4S1E4A8_9FLAO|nr:hypothetical protein [Flavivirga rizhaonensis]TGV04852.1 hypothetical protein EM932_01650 [Flavivirga rizhaonensis]
MSNNTLDELIAKVKSEAIDSAEKESQQIINDAKQKAEQLLKNTEEERLQILNEAKKEADATLDKGKIALKQAARDVHISVKNDLLKLFKAVLEAEVETAFTPELYTLVITKIIDTIGNNVDIVLPANVEDQMVDAIRQKVADSKRNFKILKREQLFSGLSVTKIDEGWSYQITAEEVSELLSHHLSQKWVEILKGK